MENWEVEENNNFDVVKEIDYLQSFEYRGTSECVG
jgi:hypothetical protein